MLKVLCLHGYRQNGETFRKKTGSFRKILRKTMEFYFLSAPFEVDAITSTDCLQHQAFENKIGTEDSVAKMQNSEEGQRGWWFSGEGRYFKATHESNLCIGFDESVERCKRFVEENGPFDGVIGFSQGAALAILLCSIQELNEWNFGFNFVVLFSGFLSKCSLHSKLLKNKLSLISLIVYGTNDELISMEMSKQLVELFDENSRTVVIHSGGHYVPSNECVKKHYIDFFAKFY